MLSAPSNSAFMRQGTLSPQRRRKYRAARSFFLVIAVVFAIAIWSFLAHSTQSAALGGSGALRKRSGLTLLHAEGEGLVRRNEECRLVHQTHDKCAFIRRNCPDEEAGLFSYLQLYYCKLHGAKPVAFAILILWLGLLFSTIGIAASDFFCINLSTISSILGMSESMAGVTFLALGNGSPDVFSTFAAMKTHSGSLAVGELIGAAGFITAVVAGSMALVRPFKVARKSFVRDVSFFIVAASFSMVFLADGRLYLWESAVMVGFYLFYVVFVVAWHWYLGQKARRKMKEAAARGHFYVPGSEEIEPELYHDEEADGPASSRRTSTRGVSADDFAALERAGTPLPGMPEDMDPDEDDTKRDHWLAEISNNMRVSRPRRGERRNTGNPIRPSLVGALEFRAVLSSLQKSRNLQTIPINLRRYSDDPIYTLAQQQAHHSSASTPTISHSDGDAHTLAEHGAQRHSGEQDRSNGASRVRAVSANDAAGLLLDPGAFQRPSVPSIDLLGPSPPGSAGLQVPQVNSASSSRRGTRSQATPQLAIEPPQGDFGYLATSPGAISISEDRSPNLLAPPGDSLPGFSVPSPPQDRTRSSAPRSIDSSPAMPFPEYRDDPSHQLLSRPPSLRLPPPSLSSDSPYNHHLFHGVEEKPISWWPYKILPSPQVLASTLFPTLYSWTDKNIWEKLLGIISAPSVFVLAITLPVVESEHEDDDLSDAVDPGTGLLSPEHARSRSHSIAILPPDSPTTSQNLEIASQEPRTTNQGRHGGHGIGAPSPLPKPLAPSSTPPLNPPPSSPKEWNRWLVATQIFTAPLFIVLILWANTSPTFSLRPLLLHTLYALLASSLTLLLLLYTTTPSQPPRYRPLFCFLGFIVAIAWISTIANEVVGVLKALGVILGISDAILGLTIFAVGNSLGDLVADITVARLGYPVMALSACFGGPMLNILLGVGISGLYMTIRGGEHRHERHPDKPMRYKPYHIEVGQTLVISGITLLVTLLGLLVVVPMNGWWMSRRIGVGLLLLWGFSTLGNVIVELVDWGRDTA